MSDAKQIQRVAAYGVVRQSNQILLSQLTRSRQWTLPGGGIDFGEHPKAAVKREVLEETGFHVEVDDLLFVHSYLKKSPDDQLQGIQIVYEAKLTGGELRNEIDGTTDLCQWHDPSQIEQLDLVDMIKFELMPKLNLR